MEIITPKTIYQQLVETGDIWAAAFECAETLRETQKILKAKLMKESQEKSISARELDALSNPAYEEHLLLALKAGGKEASAKVGYERIKILADLWRTQNANERAANRNAT